jgi:hypothetical protein
MARSFESGVGTRSLNPGWSAVDQTIMSAPGVSHPSPTTVEDFRRILDHRSVQPLFQPLIDLDSRHVVGYEALARGPVGSALEYPAALFEAAWARNGWGGGRGGRAGRGRRPGAAARDLVAEMCMQLEHQGLDAAEPNRLLACFQEADDFTPATRSRYEFLATRAAFTGALGHGMPVTPEAGVRGADLAADDPLR